MPTLPARPANIEIGQYRHLPIGGAAGYAGVARPGMHAKGATIPLLFAKGVGGPPSIKFLP